MTTAPAAPESQRAAGRPGYAALSDYGIIGDLHTAALVSRTGRIDWYCPRAFDAPSVFAAILDATRGGSCRIEPTAPYETEQRYLRGTAVLVTTFRTAEGVVELTDFMPIVSGGRRPYAEIHRRLVCVSGEVEVRVEFSPRFDYGASPTVVHPRRHGVLATDDEDEVMTLASPPEIWWAITDGTASATLKLTSTAAPTLARGAAGPGGRPSSADAARTGGEERAGARGEARGVGAARLQRPRPARWRG